jgi:hypothetical protein
MENYLYVETVTGNEQVAAFASVKYKHEEEITS